MRKPMIYRHHSIAQLEYERQRLSSMLDASRADWQGRPGLELLLSDILAELERRATTPTV
ncbi:MAG: hypothetical protein WDZ59_01405 [Pirellulales bacterium]